MTSNKNKFSYDSTCNYKTDYGQLIHNNLNNLNYKNLINEKNLKNKSPNIKKKFSSTAKSHDFSKNNSIPITNFNKYNFLNNTNSVSNFNNTINLNFDCVILKYKSEISDLKLQLHKATNEINVLLFIKQILKEKGNNTKLNSNLLEQRTFLLKDKFSEILENNKIENEKLRLKIKELEKKIEIEKEKFNKIDN